MFGLDRSRSAGRYLEWKVRIFTVGAVLAMVGMYRDERWMTGVAIGVLLLGFVLRFVPGMAPEEDDDSEEEPDHEGVPDDGIDPFGGSPEHSGER